MSVSISVADIITAVESRLRIPTCTASTAFTATEMLAAVQESVRSLYALAREKLGEDFDTLLSASLSTVANTSELALSSLTNFGELYRLVWVETTDHLVELNETPIQNFEPSGYNPRDWQRTGRNKPGYRLVGPATLVLTPCPSAVYPLWIWYTAHTPVATAADTFQGRLDWDRWVVLDVCWRVSVSKKRDGSVFVAERNTLAQSIFSPQRERSPTARRTIRDIEGSRRGWLGFDRKTGEWF